MSRLDGSPGEDFKVSSFMGYDKPPEDLREAIRLLIANAELACSEGKDYQVCRPRFANETELANQILSLIQPHISQARADTAREILKDLKDLSFRHNPIGKQRIDNFIKQALKSGYQPPSQFDQKHAKATGRLIKAIEEKE